MYQNQIQKSEAISAIIDRAAFTIALGVLSKVVERRNTVPVLSNFALQGDGDRLFVTATDLGIEAVAAIPGAADRNLAFTAPAAMLESFAKKARPSDFAAFTQGDATADVEFDSVRYTVQTLPILDFPTLPAPDSNCRFTISGADLVKLLGNTRDAISNEEARYYLNGVFFHWHAGELRAVATDGHRLMLQGIPAPEGAEPMPGVIIPRKTVQYVFGLIKGKACPESIDVHVSETKIRFSFEINGVGLVITSKVIHGTFPDYHRVIPAFNPIKVRVPADDFAGAVRDASLISSEIGRAVKISIRAGGMTASVNNPESGRASATVQAEMIGAESEMEIAFNHAYLESLIKVADSEFVIWEFAGANCPAVLTGDIDGWKAVLMPMRV